MPDDVPEGETAYLSQVRRLLESVPLAQPGDAAIIERLLELAQAQHDWSGNEAQLYDKRASIRELDVDELINMGLGMSPTRKSDV
jgi:hypothetical protein